MRSPAARAPPMSATGSSPTNTVRAGAVPRSARARSKIAGSGLRDPTAADTTTVSNRRSSPSARKLRSWNGVRPFDTTPSWNPSRCSDATASPIPARDRQ